MTEASRPSPDTVPARLVTEAEYERIMSSMAADGLHPDPTGAAIDPGGLAPVFATGSDMNVVIRAGIYGSVRGFLWTSGDTNVSKTIANNTSGTNRFDYVVLELDRATWNVRVAIVQGTPGFALPALTRTIGTTGKFQVPIAYVLVPNGSTTSFPSGNVSLAGFHSGSPVRPWANWGHMVNPLLGEIGYDQNAGRWFGWNGTNKVYITDNLSAEPVSTAQDDSGTTTSGSFTESLAGATANAQVTFTAGRQGIAVVYVSSLCKTTSIGDAALFGARIRKVSDNSIHFTPNHIQCAANEYTTLVAASNGYTVSGLTPGEQYKAVGVHIAKAGTAWFENRTIVVDPK